MNALRERVEIDIECAHHYTSMLGMPVMQSDEVPPIDGKFRQAAPHCELQNIGIWHRTI